VDPIRLRRDFEGLVRANNIMGLRVGAAVALAFVLSFGALDYIISPGKYAQLWAIRLSAATLVALILVGAFTPFARRFVQPATTVLALVVGATVAALVFSLEGHASPYYAGLSLTILAMGYLFTWSFGQSAATVFGLVAFYEVPSIVLGVRDAGTFASNSFFLGGTAVIVSVGHAFNYRLKFRAFRDSQLVLEAKREADAANAKLLELDRFKSQFFANITHELKTPLTLILTPVDLLIDGELGDLSVEQKTTLQSTRESALKLLKLIGDLLDLSKLEDAHLKLRVGRYDLVGYLRGLVTQVEPLARRKNIGLTFCPESSTAVVYCDLERMERVFVNLLSNATKYTQPGGHIVMRVRDEGETVLTEVTDDGPGFPPEKAEKLFERFYQVDMEQTRRYGGAGIGLALARELVELHGGRITAASVPGKGATFSVRLYKDEQHLAGRFAVLGDGTSPGAVREPELGLTEWSSSVAARDEFRLLDIAEATERRVVTRDEYEDRHAHTVLVVDDLPDVIRVVHLALRQQFRVINAPDGKKGLELAHKERPSLVITDFMMPEMDGLELTARLRASEETRHIPIVMLTARGDVEDRIAGMSSGVNAYLSKPFSGKELLTVVRSLLRVQETTAGLLLKNNLESLQVVAGGLAHEINNPLNYVKNSIERVTTDLTRLGTLVAGPGVSSPEQRAESERLQQRMREMLHTAASGAARIANTVALMTRYSREGFARVIQPHDAFAAARQAVDMVVPAVPRDVHVDVDLQGDGWVDCVPEELNQVITNLLQNAIEAAPDGGGRVTVGGRGEKNEVSLWVRDNGAGIAPDDQQRIFTPFFTTKSPGRGMGMGLTICWRVVQSLGGSIKVSSRVGDGTEMMVRLPRRQGGMARGEGPLT
jgi:signal transduction histidine kinase